MKRILSAAACLPILVIVIPFAGLCGLWRKLS